jgi:hypothetical protein
MQNQKTISDQNKRARKLMNNKPIATKTCLRRLTGGQPASNFSSRCRARLFGFLALAPLLAALVSTSAQAQQVNVAGQLLIDLNANRGTNTAIGMSSIAGETNLIYWTNYGTLGGTFNMILDSVYAVGYTGGTNPPAMTLLTSGSVSALAPEAPAGTRIMIASFPTPSQLQGSSHYSVECWFYNLTTANPRGVFDWTLAAPTAGFDAGELSAASTASWHNDANSLNWNPAGTAPSTSVWHYGVITYDGTTESVYLDGALANSAVHTLNIDVESINPAIFSQLGANPPTATSSSFNGAIAALRVHTEALAASDVANNYAAGIAAAPAAPTNSISTDASPATAILGATATLNGVLNATTDPTTTALTFFYDTKDDGDVTNAWPHSVTIPAPNAPGAFSANISGLTIGTKYYVRIYAVDANATNMSSFVTTFITQGKPAIANSGASFNSPGNDYLIGNLVNDGTAGGGASVTLYWGPTDGGTVPGSWANAVPLGSQTVGTISSFVSGLTTLGNYYFTFAAQNTYGTTFATPSFAFQEGLLFSLNPTNLPAASLPPAALTPVGSYPSSAGTFVTGEGAPTVHDFGGAPWLSLNGGDPDNLWLPLAAFPSGAPGSLAINGGTIVASIKPTAAVGNPWGNIVAVFFSQFGLATSPTVSTLPAGSVASVTITSGGSGYTNASGVPVPPTVTIAGPGGIAGLDSAATATVQVSSSGRVTNVIITSGGTGYPVVGGGANGNTAGTLYATTGYGPKVTFSAPTIAGRTATGTAALTPTSCVELLADVNSDRPVDTANPSGTDNGRNTRTGVYLPLNQVSIVSLVAGSGQSSGAVGDNNYIMYVNGVKVLDTDFGFITGVTLTAGGSGYTNSLGSNVPPTVTFPAPTAPGGTTATGTAVMGTGATLGVVTGVTITSAGSGYGGNGIAPGAGSANPVVTFSAPPSGVTASGIASGIPLGDYNPVAGATTLGAVTSGRNGGGMTALAFNLEGYANEATFCVGQDEPNGDDPWSGYTGYIGDVYVYGEYLPDATRQTLENAEAVKFVTGATKSFAISTFIGNGTITGPATVVQGFNATYNFIPTVAYAISGVTVDGVSVGAVTSYTFTDVSAAHSIVVTTIPVPPQNITVTYGAGGTITTNGTVIPSGTDWTGITGGTTPAFTFVVNTGFELGVIKVDGVTITDASIEAAGGTYTFANIGGNGSGPGHTLAVTFTALPSGAGIASNSVASAIPESEYLFFSVDTASLPQSPLFTGPTPITNWPMFYSTQGVTNLIQNAGGGAPGRANTFTDANGVVWEQNVEGEGATTTGYQFYTGAVGAATGAIIPNNGATIVTVVSPALTSTGEGDPWHAIVDVFFGCVELSVNPGTGLIQAIVDNDHAAYDGAASAVATSTYAIPSGSNTVLSLVVQSNGSFAVYANTVEVITNAGLGPLYIEAGFQGYTFANNIDLGDDGPDTWAAFNGLIGNTYFWTTALTTAERTNLEAALMTQFHAVVPPNYNWIGPNGGNWSSPANWSNTVPFAVNTVPGTGGGETPVFSLQSLVPLPGLTVNLDQSETVSGLSFNTNTIITSTAGSTLTLGDTTGAGAITVTAGSPIIEVPLQLGGALTANVGGSGTLLLSNTVNLNGAFTVNGPGTLVLSSNVTLGGTTSSYLEVNPNGVNSSVTVVQTGGTITTFGVAQSWSQANGPGVMLGGASTNTTAIYTLSGGTLITPNIGCVTENFAVTPNVLVPPSVQGATAILNLNGGVIQASDNDSTDIYAVAEGSDHLIFNTSHTYVQVGGAIINTAGFNDSIAVPLEHYPYGPAVDGGLTKMGFGTLSNLYTATYTGPTVVSNGILACETATSLGGNSVTIVPGAQLQLDFTGTTKVYQLITNNGSPVPPGVYGSTASGAAHKDDTDFVPGTTGTLTVLGTITIPETPSFTSTSFVGSTGTGSLVLKGTGGVNGGTYLVLGSTNVAAPLTNWVTLAQGTFTAAGFSVSIPVTNTVPQEFIRIVVP